MLGHCAISEGSNVNFTSSSVSPERMCVAAADLHILQTSVREEAEEDIFRGHWGMPALLDYTDKLKEKHEQTSEVPQQMCG